MLLIGKTCIFLQPYSEDSSTTELTLQRRLRLINYWHDYNQLVHAFVFVNISELKKKISDIFPKLLATCVSIKINVRELLIFLIATRIIYAHWSRNGEQTMANNYEKFKCRGIKQANKNMLYVYKNYLDFYKVLFYFLIARWCNERVPTVKILPRYWPF